MKSKEENIPQDLEEKVKNKKDWKYRVWIILVLIFLSLGLYFYSWYQSTQRLRTEAKQVIEKAGKYEEVLNKIQAEESRCENFIIQQEGDFSSFEYCKKFINWVNN